MAITLRKRSRRRDSTPAGTLDEVAQSERAAMTALAETLRQAAAELPGESRLAVEFARIARCIDVAGVLGTWALDTLVRESPRDTTPRPPARRRQGSLVQSKRPATPSDALSPGRPG